MVYRQYSPFTSANSSAFNRLSPVWLVYVAACPSPNSLSNGHTTEILPEVVLERTDPERQVRIKLN